MSVGLKRKRLRKFAALNAATLLLSVLAVAGPLASPALAVPCTNEEAATLDLTPATETNEAGTSHTVTAHVEDANGDPCQGVLVDFAVTGDNTDGDEIVTDVNGDATFTYPDAVATDATNDTITAWVDQGTDNDTLDGGEPSDTATKTWETAVADSIDCVNQDTGTDTSNNETGTNHTVQCTVEDQFGDPFSVDGAGGVHFVVTGANPTSGDDENDSPTGVYTFTYTGANSGADTIEGCIDADSGNDCDGGEVDDTANKTWEVAEADTIDCDAEGETNPLGTQHTVTCTVQDQFGQDIQGVNVDVEFKQGSPNDPQGDGTASPVDVNNLQSDANGEVEHTWTGNTAGTDTVCFWIDADNDTDVDHAQCDGAGGDEEGTGDDTDDLDVVAKTWTSGQEQGLECAPERSANHRALSHTIGCQLVEEDDQTTPVNLAGVQVKVEATGANDPDSANPSANPDFTCTTNASGSCTFTHDPGGPGIAPANLATVGTTTYRAWVGTAPDATEGRDEDAQPGSTQEAGINADNTDVVEKTWHAEATTLTLTPESDSAASGVCNVFTVTLTDSGGRPVGNAEIDIRQRHADFGTANAGASDEPTFCTQPGVTAADPNAPNPSGVNTYAPGTGTDAATQGETLQTTNADGQVSFGIRLDNGTGQVTVLTWCEDAPECPTGTANDNIPQNNEPQDQSTKTWGEGGADAVETADAEPEAATNPNGTSHTFTVTLRNAQGDPVQGVMPLATITSGPNAGAVTINCTNSNAQGVSTCNYADSGASPTGTDNITVWVNQSAAAGGGSVGLDAGEPSDSITKTWVNPPQGLAIDVTCDDSDGPSQDATADNDQNALENNVDCGNPLSQPNETFTARVTNPNGTATPNDDTPVSGVQVRFAIINESPADLGLVEAGGTNGPAICNTGADGRCSVTLNNPTPAAGDFADVTGTIAGQTSANPFGNSADTASKVWAAAGQAFILNLTPQGATNLVNTSHTVTATVLDVFRNPVVGENVDFFVTGRNTLNGLDRTTNSAGQATFTYNDGGPAASNGMDTIDAHADSQIEDDVQGGSEPGDDAVKFWVTQLPNTQNVRLDMEMDDNPNNDDCPGNLTAVGAPDETGAGGFNDNAEVPNSVGSTHEICAVAFDENNNVIVDGSITFSLTGPGNFTNAAGDNLGNSVTVPVDQAGHAHALITSTATGTTTVTATKDNQSDSGDKVWVAFPGRNIDCTPEDGLNEPGEDHEVDCLVTDRNGNPVAGYQVFGTESGPGTIQQTGGISCDPLVTGSPNTCIQVTDSNGVAPFVLQNNTNSVGDQTFTGELLGDVGGGRATANAAVDECERPVDNPAGAPAGNCTDQVSKTWQTDVDECSDGQDNDGDGDIDFPADDGCDSPEDDDESDEEPEVPFGPCQGFQEGSENTDPAVSGRIIVGTQGSDILTGTQGDDIICGLDGNDIIAGGGGEDLIVGNEGNDTIEGNGGKDTINGNRDSDTIDGNRKNDVIRGSKGDDTLRGNRGFDTIRGGSSKDTLQGGRGDDLLRGGGGNDTLKGFNGDDILNGGGGTDTCRPGRGNDQVRNCEN